MEINVTRDLWEYLARTDKTVVMYGMGNGADKILGVCEARGIAVAEFFASDGFVRGQVFHGKTVLSWSAVKEKYGTGNLIVLLSFGTSRPEVLEVIESIAEEVELYAPDVPAFGDGLFDRAFFEAHRAELVRTWEMLSDDESRRIFENVIAFKLTGDIRRLADAESDYDRVWEDLIRPDSIAYAADLGAYNGDTVRALLDRAGGRVERIWAMEPDLRNHRKLQAYAEGESRAEVIAVHAGAWSREELLCFDASGNRNASFGTNRSEALADRPAKMTEIRAMPLDAVLQGARVDYIKYDVEGSEREALLGSRETITEWSPRLLVSLYHRNEDIYDLPLLIGETFSDYNRFYLRRRRGVPAWDLELFCLRER
jgi:FkbM family methyltransferase